MEPMAPKRTRTPRMAPVLVAALTLAGCADSTAPDENLSANEAEAVALFLSDADGSGAFLLAPDFPVPGHDFERIRPCPEGGSHAVSGSRSREVDPESRIASSAWTTTQTHEACAHTRRIRGQEITVVIDGSVSAAGTATHLLPESPGTGRELLSYENIRSGSTTTTIGDRTRICEISITESYDPATDTFSITGSICGRDVSATRNRPSKPFGT